MRKLFFTTGSPFARAVRIVLVEKGLDFERAETYTTPSAEDRAKVTPTLQVPTLVDGELTLWDSAVIIDYLKRSSAQHRRHLLSLCSINLRCKKDAQYKIDCRKS